MTATVTEVHGVRVLAYAETGSSLACERDANDFLAEAWGNDAAVVAIPVSRLAEDFFKLPTGLAGAVAQKFVNYQLRLAIVGDVTDWTAGSRSLRDFIREANRGRALWFVTNMDELAARIADENSAR